MKLTVSSSSQLATHFKSLRRAKGWSQADLGRKLGLGQARVAQIEGDPGSIGVDKFLQILHLLDAKLVIETQVESERAKPVFVTQEDSNSERAKPVFVALMKRSEREKPVFVTLMKKSEKARRVVNVPAQQESVARAVEPVGSQRRLNLQRDEQSPEAEKPVFPAAKTDISISFDSGLLTPKPPLAKKKLLPPSKSGNKSSKLSITKKK
ncbi:MAG: helix-turn-helix domain-containing protein [Oxalobacteraceae bacterium]|nr:helix-turn-helix domain-containing protein [Oxalobacteraceae bacterium]